MATLHVSVVVSTHCRRLIHPYIADASEVPASSSRMVVSQQDEIMMMMKFVLQ
jgi:hypothetical protein